VSLFVSGFYILSALTKVNFFAANFRSGSLAGNDEIIKKSNNLMGFLNPQKTILILLFIKIQKCTNNTK